VVQKECGWKHGVRIFVCNRYLVNKVQTRISQCFVPYGRDGPP
jgi:hypothetical protein